MMLSCGKYACGYGLNNSTAARVTSAYRELLDPGGSWRLSPSTVAGYHWMGVSPCAVRYSLVRLKCRLPKNPL